MKKFLFALCGLVFGVSFAAADNIKMVTYFPVPYASYGDLGVAGTCDVGLLGSCKLDLGQGLTVSKLSSDSRPLNTGSLIVRNGKLALNSTAANSQIATPVLTSGSSATTGMLSFSHNLTINTIKGSQVQSLEATNRADMSQLYLFSNASDRLFPVCDDAEHSIAWKNLTVNGDSGVFLVCGAGQEVQRKECSDTCPSGYIRNPDVQYEDQGDCCIEAPQVYYFICQQPTRGICPTSNNPLRYSSYAEAKEACESGLDPAAWYQETNTTHGAMGEYAKCGTPENEEYIQSQQRYAYEGFAFTPTGGNTTVEKPIDPPVFESYCYKWACSSSCVECNHTTYGWNNCRCTLNLGHSS